MRLYQTNGSGTTASLINTYGSLDFPFADVVVGSFYKVTVTVGGLESPFSNFVEWTNPT
jgi:hypothetical protein